MTCRCGFNFAKASLDGRKYDSYAVIHNADYEKLMDNEAKVRAAKSTRRRFKLLGEGVQFVGSLLVCPECGLVTLLLPGRAGASESRIVLKPLV